MVVNSSRVAGSRRAPWATRKALSLWLILSRSAALLTSQSDKPGVISLIRESLKICAELKSGENPYSRTAFRTPSSLTLSIVENPLDLFLSTVKSRGAFAVTSILESGDFSFKTEATSFACEEFFKVLTVFPSCLTE